MDRKTRTSVLFCQCGVKLSISTRGTGERIEVFCPVCGKSLGTNFDMADKDIIVYVREQS